MNIPDPNTELRKAGAVLQLIQVHSLTSLLEGGAPEVCSLGSTEINDLSLMLFCKLLGALLNMCGQRHERNRRPEQNEHPADKSQRFVTGAAEFIVVEEPPECCNHRG